MNGIYEIRARNDIAAARGAVLTWDKTTRSLKLRGEILGPTFMCRRDAARWCREVGATLAVV